MDRNKVICRCMNVNYGTIQDTVNSGAKTFDEVQAKTKCSTGCGCCKLDVEEIIKDLTK